MPRLPVGAITDRGLYDEDAEVVLFLGSVPSYRENRGTSSGEGAKVGVFTANILSPFPADMYTHCKNAKTIIIGDRQDSYGAGGGNMTLEIKAMPQRHASAPLKDLRLRRA